MPTETAQQVGAQAAQSQLRVLIADDARDFRVLLRLTLQQHPALLVVAEAADGVEAVTMCEREKPDVAVLDVAMPRMDGLEATVEIRRRSPATRIIVLSAFSFSRIGQQAIDAGADAYLEKSVGKNELLEVITGARPGAAVPAVITTPAEVRPELGQPPSGLHESLILDAVAAGVLVVGANRQVEIANSSACETLNTTPSELVGAALANLVTRLVSEDGTSIEPPGSDPITVALTTGRAQPDTPVGLVRADGTMAWLRMRVHPLRAAGENQPSAVVVSFLNITTEWERRQREHQHARCLEAALDQGHDPVAVATPIRDRSGNVERFRLDFLNAAARVLRSATSSTGNDDHDLLSIFPATVRERLTRSLTHMIDTGRPEEIPASSYPVPGKPHEVARYTVQVTPVLQALVLHWRQQAAPPALQGARAAPSGGLAGANRLLESAVVASPEGLAVFDQNGDLVLLNPVADRLLAGSPLLGHAGKVTAQVLLADARTPAGKQDLPTSGMLTAPILDHLTLCVRRPEQPADVYLDLSSRPVTDEAGDRIGAVVAIHDDTQRQRAQQELATAHRELEHQSAELKRSNNDLEQFASLASHDLSAPLDTIIGFARLLEQRTADQLDPEAAEFLQWILAGATRMRTLIDDLLAYARVSTGASRNAPVDLNAVVGEVVAALHERVQEAHAQISVDALPTVVADQSQLRQLMQNLLTNALTFTNPNLPPTVTVNADRMPGAVRITVGDNGIGIPADARERVFGMFTRLHSRDEYPGTGIGLAICKRIVDHHGGRIWIEDNPHGGTLVRFTLPDRS